MRKPLIAGNWKLNGDRELVRQMVNALGEPGAAEVVICPPAVLLDCLVEAVRSASSSLAVGAQNVAANDSGAFTGEISAAMLDEAGCHYCIVGHSERRALFGESDSDVLEKTWQLLEAHLTPIVCVGETQEERNAGQAEAVIDRQLRLLLGELSDTELARLVFAYEPVWAIGTGNTASNEQAQEMHAHIRQQLTARGQQDNRLLYGGSVNPDNAAGLMQQQDIDGALVGGASLKPDSFMAIIAAANG